MSLKDKVGVDGWPSIDGSGLLDVEPGCCARTLVLGVSPVPAQAAHARNAITTTEITTELSALFIMAPFWKTFVIHKHIHYIV